MDCVAITRPPRCHAALAVGNVLIDLGLDPVTTIANLDRLWEVTGTDQTSDMRVAKLDAFV
jgi:hypothetical protein